MNFYFVFAIFLDGADEFTAASQDMIKSPIVPPEVKTIFEHFIAGIAKLKPCLDQANLQCILDDFINTGVSGVEQGIKLSNGSLKKLFQRMLHSTGNAVEIYRALRSADVPQVAAQSAVQIANSLFRTQAKWIRNFLQQSKAK